MSIVKLIDYEEAGPEVRQVYDDIMATRGTDWVNNWQAALPVAAQHPSDKLCQQLMTPWEQSPRCTQPPAR